MINDNNMIFWLYSAEYLEGVYVQSPFVQQIFVYGDSLKSVLVAIVVPKADNLKLWAKQEGLEVCSLTFLSIDVYTFISLTISFKSHTH
jgi:long-chain acyl-CoA synthetase